MLRAAAIGIVTLSTVACTEEWGRYMLQRLQQRAEAAVRQELVGSQTLTLTTRSNPWGEGLFVYPISHGSYEPSFVWLYVRDQAFALGKQEGAVTPHILPLDNASDDIREVAGLAKVARSEIAQYLSSPTGFPLPQRKGGGPRGEVRPPL